MSTLSRPRAALKVVLAGAQPGEQWFIAEALHQTGRAELAAITDLDGLLAAAREAGAHAVLLDLEAAWRCAAAVERLHREAPEVAIILLADGADRERMMDLVRAGADDSVTRGELSGYRLADLLERAVERRRRAVGDRRRELDAQRDREQAVRDGLGQVREPLAALAAQVREWRCAGVDADALDLQVQRLAMVVEHLETLGGSVRPSPLADDAVLEGLRDRPRRPTLVPALAVEPR